MSTNPFETQSNTARSATSNNPFEQDDFYNEEEEEEKEESPPPVKPSPKLFGRSRSKVDPREPKLDVLAQNEPKRSSPALSPAPSSRSRQLSDREQLLQQQRQQQHERPNFDEDTDVWGRSKFADEEGDKEVSNIKQQIRDTKQESVESTRRALQAMNASQTSGAETLGMLGEQSTQIANIDRNLDLSKAHAEHGASQAKELKKLNRSIFIPNIKNPFTKKKRQQLELDRARQSHAEHREERDAIRQFEHQSQARVDRAAREGGRLPEGDYRPSQSDRNRYQFEADAEDDAMEEEIGQNLDALGHATRGLKQMATAMSTEIDSQNQRLDRVNDKTDPLSDRIFTTTEKLHRIR
ncbi:hypothetical protein BCR43DRAFT_504935 [Syncephalastrum racemosum]|uniref:t-SNARE coiled-coil homology domain-containing protein n=1 Tax=Syncephalastrum racemosum TaxID=13706 RepID=A0A1X2HGQ5_SYNRA|nr:hypothetical protein BCR43DRAFT_504935 [Syncephalastrum racemosum]